MLITKKNYNYLIDTIKDLDNENNKLHKNLIIIREFYQDQKLNQLNKIRSLKAEINLYKNVLNDIKALLENKNVSVSELVKGDGIVNIKETILKTIKEMNL